MLVLLLRVLFLFLSAVSAASVYESNWHLQANADAVSAETARLSRLHFDVAAEWASVQFRDGALCVRTQGTNADIDVAASPRKGSVAMRLRVTESYIYELFLTAWPWSLSVFRFNEQRDASDLRRVGVFPPELKGFHEAQTPLNVEDTTLPSNQTLLWVVFTWSSQGADVWWNLDGKFNNNASTLRLHSGVPGTTSSNVSFFLRYHTFVCVEALMISDSITDAQRALNDLEEKTGKGAPRATRSTTTTAAAMTTDVTAPTAVAMTTAATATAATAMTTTKTSKTTTMTTTSEVVEMTATTPAKEPMLNAAPTATATSPKLLWLLVIPAILGVSGVAGFFVWRSRAKRRQQQQTQQHNATASACASASVSPTYGSSLAALT